MNKRIIEIGLNRAKLLAVNPKSGTSKKLRAIFLAELANLGYRIENPELLNDSVFENFDLIIDTLTKMKGGDVKYVPLFSGFPNKVDYDNDVLIATFGGLIDRFGYNLFDWIVGIENFDGLISSRSQTDEELAEGIADQESRKSDKHTEWTTLKVSNDIEGDVRKYLAGNLYAKSSIKETLKDDIEFLIGHYGLEFLDASKVVFKEIKSYVMKYLWNKGDYATLSKFVGTPTDILRMFAAITDSDISLAENIKFPKLSRPQRRFVLENIEKCSNIAENLNAYKGLWLSLGRYIHPGEYRSKFPKTFKAFDTLRNDKVPTYNGLLENAIKKGDLNTVLSLASKRPGIFGRKLHEILDVFSSKTGVIREFKKVADQLELKNLLVLEKYFETINDSEYRTVINKKGRVIVFPNDKKGKLSKERIEKLNKAIKEAIVSKVTSSPLEFEEGTKVWIDPALRSYVVPLSLRKQSDGLMNISRGTRISFDKTKTLRLFNYWKESSRRTDFDTSLIEFDKDMNYKGHVSYTRLNGEGISHSGDITSAPNGASEFIDIDMTKLKSDVKYLAIQVYKYSGESFTQVEKSYAGWMVRDKDKAGRKTFDIKTVANKFNMVGKGAYAIPMIVDVESGEIIYVDLYMNGQNSLNRVEGAVNNVSTVAREIVKMVDTKPNMLDLITYQVNASNAELVEDKEEATVTYGIDGCTHSVDRVDEILAELL
jgi:stress response protein SCP2